MKGRDILKILVGILFYYGGVFHFIRFINNIIGKRLTIVTYHRVTDSKIEAINTSLPYLFVNKATFEKQLLFLKKHYRVITFNSLIRYVQDNNIPWNSLIITFDDGYEDIYQSAYPMLRKLNLRATVFLIVNMVGNDNFKPFWWDRAYYYFNELVKVSNKRTNPDKKISSLVEDFTNNPSKFFSTLNGWDTNDIDSLLSMIKSKYEISEDLILQANRMINWQQVEDLGDNVEIGSHTCNHVNLLNLEKDYLSYEIDESRRIIENKTKKKVKVFSYPYGNFDSAVEDMVKDSGYTFAVTTERGINKLTDMLTLKRINIWEKTSNVDGKFSKGCFTLKLLGF